MRFVHGDRSHGPKAGHSASEEPEEESHRVACVQSPELRLCRIQTAQM